MAADYRLVQRPESTPKKAIEIVIARSVEMEGSGSRKFSYQAYLADVGDRLEKLGARPEKEIRIRLPEDAKPEFARRFLYAPQHFFMLKFRLEGNRASAINAHEDYNRATPEWIRQPLFMAAYRDLESEGATTLNLGRLRQGRRTGIPFSKIEPLIDARIRASGFEMVPVYGQ